MMLEVLRGAATAALPTTFEALSALFSGLLSPLLTLHSAFKHIAHVVALLLKLADDIVEALTGYMESQQQKEQLLNWVLQLLAQYRDSNLWQVSSMQVAVASRAAQRWMCLVSSWLRLRLRPRLGASTSTCAEQAGAGRNVPSRSRGEVPNVYCPCCRSWPVSCSTQPAVAASHSRRLTLTQCHAWLPPHHPALVPVMPSCCQYPPQVSLQTAKSLQAERAAEQCRDLRAVLNLLIHITQSDLSGGEDDDGLGHSLASVAPAGVWRTRNRQPARQLPTLEHFLCRHLNAHYQ